LNNNEVKNGVMKYKIKTYSIWEKGQRPNQEDSIYPPMGKMTDDDRLFILCDGMGGHEKGEVASATVCEAMSQYIKKNYSQDRPFSREDFNLALEAAYDELDKKDTGGEKKMGTTLTFLIFHQDGVLIAHIGDSRVYQVRPSEQKILFQTRDHSLVNDLIDVNELTPEEAKTFPRKNVITRAIQPHQEKRVRADFKEISDIQAGDYFLLCSDGLLEQMENHNIVNILSDNGSSDEEKIEIMKQVSTDSRDNHSAHLIHVLEIDKADTDCKHDAKEDNRPIAIIQDEETSAKESMKDNEQESVNEQEPKEAELKENCIDLVQKSGQLTASTSQQNRMTRFFKENKLFKPLAAIIIIILAVFLICIKLSKTDFVKNLLQTLQKTEIRENHGKDY